MKLDLLGVKINSETRTEVLNGLATRLNQNKPVLIVTPYSESIVAAQQDEEFRQILNAAEFALPDGVGILWATNFRKRLATGNKRSGWKKFPLLVKTLALVVLRPALIRDPIPEKISGSEFVWDLAELAARTNQSVFLLGGFDSTPALAAQRLKARFPELRIAGTYTGHPAEAGLVEKINAAGADFLFVAFGPITQEKWLFQNLPNLRVKLAMGVGGTLDYLARIRPYRPKFWALRGLEWLFRLLTQPWRAGRVLRGVFGLIRYTYKARL